MNEELKELRKELEEIKARATADTAFLRCFMFTLGTAQLRGALASLKDLSESMSIRFLYGTASDTAGETFEQRRRFWLDALEMEIAARDGA